MQNSPASRSSGRHPRWSRDEILILTEAKQAYENQCNTSCLGCPLESKWTYVSSYCREREVERGPLQCRKRWSNLAWDFKRIKHWEMDMAKSGRDQSYWLMRSDARREKKLPGFFYPEVFEMMTVVVDRNDDQVVNSEVKEEEVVFDQAEEAEEEMLATTEAIMTEPVVVVPLSVRKYLPENEQYSGNSNDNAKGNKNEKAYSSREGKKRRRTNGAPEETSFESKLIEVVENNSRILSAQFEAYNLSYQLDREERKEQTDSLISVMTRIADVLGKIADKL